MPQAAIPIGAAVAPMILGQLFGDDKQGAQSQANAGLNQLSQAQLADTERRAGLNQTTQDYLMAILNQDNSGGNNPGGYLDLSSFGATGGGPELYNKLAPGIQRMNALKMLMPLGGNVGTGGVMSNAQMATGINQRDEDRFSDSVAGIIDVIGKMGVLDGQQGNQQAPVSLANAPTGQQVFDAFNNTPGFFG